ncbi:hypothetical protein HDV01_004722 [Terramyces sp. JEL0728]|nr:hypothetical protein HDV01_004722 [Terramyces sp. JEL0728]
MYGVTSRGYHSRDEKLHCISFYPKNDSETNDFTLTQLIFSRFQYLNNLKKPPFLAEYIDLVKTSNGQLAVVSSKGDSAGQAESIEQVRKYALDILVAIDYLHKNGIIIRNLSLENIYRDLEYMAPEILNYGPYKETTSKCDIWSFGIALLELYFGSIFESQSIGDLVTNALERTSLMDKLESIEDQEFKSFVTACFEEDETKRPDTDALINHPWFKDLEVPNTWHKRPHISKSPKNEQPFHPNLKEAYYFWKLMGGDVERELADKNDSAQKYLLALPSTILKETNIKALAVSLQQRPLYTDSFKDINMENLWSELQSIKKTVEKSFSITSTFDDTWKYPVEWSANNQSGIWERYNTKPSLALNAKNVDTKYQFLRLFLFKSLLKKYPQTLPSIKQEAIKDIPSLLRGQIWAALLQVTGDTELEYEQFQLNTDDSSDKQLDLDIPRCHQYHELLATPLGHEKLKRVLKAWILCEKGKQVYWQGLDSLCACFLTLNFHNEVMVF